ncbi:MAG TPA: hypothetical protein PKE58_09870, partial [Acidobacteriota bacterium]|nr:hypothetical protein [Acidobacteriota bacterium]
MLTHKTPNGRQNGLQVGSLYLMEMDGDSESGLIICNWHFEFNHLSDAVRGCLSDFGETRQQAKQGDSHIDGRIAVKL